MYPVKLYQNLLLKMMARRTKCNHAREILKIKYYRIFFQPNDKCRIRFQFYQKKIRKLKNGVSILTFIINEYKTWLSLETAGISRTAKVIVLQKCCQTQSVPFPLIYSVGHQVQDHSYLDENNVSWIESLIHVTTQCVLLCPYVGY